MTPTISIASVSSNTGFGANNVSLLADVISADGINASDDGSSIAFNITPAAGLAAFGSVKVTFDYDAEYAGDNGAYLKTTLVVSGADRGSMRAATMLGSEVSRSNVAVDRILRPGPLSLTDLANLKVRFDIVGGVTTTIKNLKLFALDNAFAERG